MRQAYLVVGLPLGLAVAVSALQNATAVEGKFFAWQATGSLAAEVLGSAGAGALVALFGTPEIVAARWRIRGLERRLRTRARFPLNHPGEVEPLLRLLAQVLVTTNLRSPCIQSA